MLKNSKVVLYIYILRINFIPYQFKEHQFTQIIVRRACQNARVLNTADSIAHSALF